MRNDFEQGAYNVHEHNHTEWSDELLSEKLLHIEKMMGTVKYSGERLEQLQREMGHIVREQVARYYEKNGESVAEAWRQLYE